MRPTIRNAGGGAVHFRPDTKSGEWGGGGGGGAARFRPDTKSEGGGGGGAVCFRPDTKNVGGPGGAAVHLRPDTKSVGGEGGGGCCPVLQARYKKRGGELFSRRGGGTLYERGGCNPQTPPPPPHGSASEQWRDGVLQFQHGAGSGSHSGGHCYGSLVPILPLQYYWYYALLVLCVGAEVRVPRHLAKDGNQSRAAFEGDSALGVCGGGFGGPCHELLLSGGALCCPCGCLHLAVSLWDAHLITVSSNFPE